MTEHPEGRPPVWAEGILRLLLEPEHRESVSGDLLEEYRRSIVPALGGGADGWYVRQVGGFLWRASWQWGALVGATLIVRYMFDTLVPVTNYVQRSKFMSWTIIAIFMACACRNAWRTGRFRTGLLAAIAAGVIGGVMSSLGSGVLLAIWHDPATMREWRNSGGLDEAFIGVPLIMVVVSAISGIQGALVGKALSWTRRQRVAE
jgi:hypothetical protein